MFLPTKEYCGIWCIYSRYVFVLSRPSFKLQFKFLLVDTYIGDKSQHYAMQFTCGYRKTVLQTKPFFPYKKEKGMAKKKWAEISRHKRVHRPLCGRRIWVIMMWIEYVNWDWDCSSVNTIFFESMRSDPKLLKVTGKSPRRTSLQVNRDQFVKNVQNMESLDQYKDDHKQSI